MKTRSLILTAAIGFSGTFLVPTTGSACGPRDTCVEVGQSLVATILVDGIRVAWDTTQETPDIDRFEVYRYNCGDPRLCAQPVVTFQAGRVCSVPRHYEYVDHPPVSPSPWKYSVEVWLKGGPSGNFGRVCAEDTRAQ